MRAGAVQKARHARSERDQTREPAPRRLLRGNRDRAEGPALRGPHSSLFVASGTRAVDGHYTALRQGFRGTASRTCGRILVPPSPRTRGRNRRGLGRKQSRWRLPVGSVRSGNAAHREHPASKGQAKKGFSHRRAGAILWSRLKRWSAKAPFGLPTLGGAFARFCCRVTHPISPISPPSRVRRPDERERWERDGPRETSLPAPPPKTGAPHRQNPALSGSR